MKAYPPPYCDVCGEPLTKGKWFFDAKTKRGPWAWLCELCFLSHSIGKLGTGYGQKYNAKTLEKVKG